MARVTVTPTEGRRVRDEAGNVLTEGEASEVEYSIFWHRRAECGDVEVGTIKAESEKTPKSAKRASSPREES